MSMAITGCEDTRARPGGRDGSQSGTRIDHGRRPGLADVSTNQPEPEPPPPPREKVWPPKAIWVARGAYRSPEEIAAMMDRICQAGFNTVLFQVRGEGTTYYPSKIEPWSESYGASGPGFDPLQVACREAHRRGMALHAWVNVVPGWRGATRPSNPRQLYNAHPDWFWYDQKGRRQPLAPFYLGLNPCLPEVRQYLVSLMREIVSQYPVDGLHMDYIRFPLDKVTKGVDYPYDKRTLWIYKRDTGKRPQDDKAAWDRWRTSQVTQLVREIRSMQRQARPDLLLTAACGGDIDDYKRHYFQDGASWLRSGWVDAVFTMNYATRTTTFRSRQDAWRRAAAGKMVVPGLGEYMHTSDAMTIEQLKVAKQYGRGVAIFSYASLFEENKPSRIAAIRNLIR